MFRFREISLIGWDLWSPVRIPLDRDVVMLVGPNGSGKTTLLDAIRQLLNAPRLSSRRRLQHYLRRPDAPALIRAVVSNGDPLSGNQPFRRERIHEPEVTLACALVPTGGAPEKRFAILPGRVPAEDIRRRLLESRDYLKPERYARALQNAGVTRSLMSVLAIEQGRTNSLFEMRPRELYGHVLDMLGDRAVLERYREVRRRYEDSEREVMRQMQGLQARQVDLAAARRDVELRESWENARDRVVELTQRLPAARLQVLLRERRDTEAKIPELRTRVRNDDSKRQRTEDELADSREALQLAERASEAAREQEREATARLVETKGEHARAEAVFEDLEQARRDHDAIPAGDIEQTERNHTQASRVFFAAEAALRDARGTLDRAEADMRTLQSGAPILPAPVKATLKTLEDSSIPATTLGELVDVPGPEGAAAEAALADARWCIVVDSTHESEAIDIARANGFPGPVYSGEILDSGTTVGPLVLSPGAPAWLKDWMASVELDKDGSWLDDKGTWPPRAVQRVLGETGRKAALDAARRRVEADRGAVDEAEASLADASDTLARSRERFDLQIRRRDLAGRIEALPEARGHVDASRSALEQAAVAADGATAAREGTDEERMLRRDETRSVTDRLDALIRSLEGFRTSLAEMEQRVVECDEQIGELGPTVADPLYERAERMELDGEDTVKADLDRAQASFDRLGDPPGPEVREEARHLERNVVEMEQHVKARREESERARAELTECRRRYLDVVGAALHDYRRRAVALARSANVAIEMDLPHLEDDDRILDEAGIRVSFGFDGKQPLPLGDPSFSGGQQVIAGLVLLMAMVEIEGKGFFILDEPFAHLSVDRVDEVGKFLRASGAQFILTAPTTLDRAQLDPASAVIMLRKKPAGEDHAPLPVVAEA